MDQHEYVAKCQRYYAENGYEPGNPAHGEWHKAHYPMPRHLGGRTTVLLLAEDHAIHGVLQSEEYQCCCIWGWEKQYLCGSWLDRAQVWLTHRARTVWADLPEEEAKRRRTLAVETAKRNRAKRKPWLTQ